MAAGHCCRKLYTEPYTFRESLGTLKETVHILRTALSGFAGAGLLSDYERVRPVWPRRRAILRREFKIDMPKAAGPPAAQVATANTFTAFAAASSHYSLRTRKRGPAQAFRQAFAAFTTHRSGPEVGPARFALHGGPGRGLLAAGRQLLLDGFQGGLQTQDRGDGVHSRPGQFF